MAPAGVAQEAATVAHVHGEGVGGDHEALEEQHGGAVTDQTIALHFAQTQPAVARPSLRRLASQNGARALGTRVHLVEDHVLSEGKIALLWVGKDQHKR